MNEIFVGKTTDGANVALEDDLRTSHVQIVGATGRGKTESIIIPWMVQDVLQGKSTILIDGKGDQSILNKMRDIYDSQNMSLEELVWLDLADIENSFSTNPLKYGMTQQIVDRLFSTLEFEKAYFKAVSYEAALLASRIIKAQKSEQEITFEKLYDMLTDEDVFSGFAKTISNSNLEREAKRFLGTSYKDRQEKLSGLLSQIQPFARGELSPLLNGKGARTFSLSELMVPSLSGNTTKTAVLMLPTLLYQSSAAKLGQMFLQEIAWAVAMKEKESEKEFCSIFLDEFSAFVYEGFTGLLNKARSTKTALHLSHQSLGDLEMVSHEFAKVINTNTNVKCVLGVNDPVTADYFAKHFGTRGSQKMTERVERKSFGDIEKTGLMSMRDVEEYKIHPNLLKHYAQGMGVLSLIVNGKPVTEEMQFARSFI